MNLIPLCTLVVVGVVALLGGGEARPQTSAAGVPGIPREFQNVNIENYLRNERAVRFQLKCVIYNGPCDNIGKYLKANIPSWLGTQCQNCNDESKKHAGKLINFFQENYPKEWDDAVVKYGKAKFSDEEIARFASDLGVQIIRDPSKPTKPPGSKPDHALLASLAKEGIAAAKTTSEPLILVKDSTTQIAPKAP